jgi:phenylacetate-coenzyme A ligase PaaK-like adenylate-forming protein
MPLPEMVDGLNRAHPKVEALQGWPNVIRRLAQEALAGRLTITPTWVAVAGEMCTPAVREAVRAAWGVEPAEFWGCSEGTYAFPCDIGEGKHIADDLVILESVDTEGNVVPYGQPGDRLLLTSLYNLDQPLIRYDLADAVTISDEPCPCGCAHKRITGVHGRIDGEFGYEGGVSVPRRAVERAVLAAPGLADFAVRQTRQGLDVSVVTNGSGDLELVRADLADVLRRSGLAAPEVTVREVGDLERFWSGKTRQFEPIAAT